MKTNKQIIKTLIWIGITICIILEILLYWKVAFFHNLQIAQKLIVFYGSGISIIILVVLLTGIEERKYSNKRITSICTTLFVLFLILAFFAGGKELFTALYRKL